VSHFANYLKDVQWKYKRIILSLLVETSECLPLVDTYTVQHIYLTLYS